MVLSGMIAAIVRAIFATLFVLLFVAIVLFVLALEDTPAVAEATAPTPEDVKSAKEFVRGIRTPFGADEATEKPFATTEAQLNSVIRLGARFIPGFRGKISVIDGGLEGRAAIPVPYTGERWWLNLRAIAPEFEGNLRLSRAEFGRFSLPPDLALETLRVGANLTLGNELGDTVLSAADAMYIEDDVVMLSLTLKQVGQNGIIRGVFGTLRGSDMPQPDDIQRYYTLIRTAMETGELPAQGSYLPYLLFTLQAAYDGSDAEGAQNSLTSALLALTRVCGAFDFNTIVDGLGETAFGDKRTWSVNCKELTLNGRIDSRRHFTTAATIQAASNRGFAVSVGEFKELHDTLQSGGFDFTDIAANNSGIRMVNLFMATPADQWPGLLARIKTENDVIVTFDGIPQIMSGDEFEKRYRDVDSPEYYAVLDYIEKRIDELALHR